MATATNKEPNDFQTRWTLIRELTKTDCEEQSWLEFYHIYQKLIFIAATRSGLSREEAEDAVQETMRTVYANIRNFKPDPAHGSFKSWLMKTAHWRIVDLLKKRNKALKPTDLHSDDSNQTPAIERLADPASLNFDAQWELAWQKELFAAAIQRTRDKVSPEQFQIFDLHHLRHKPVSEVARALGISAARIYLASHRVLKLVKKEAVLLEKALN